MQGFPLDSGTCSCVGCDTEYVMCDILLTPQINLTSGNSPVAVSNNNPDQIVDTDVFEFTGETSSTANSIMSDSVRDQAMNISDNFSTSIWVYVEESPNLQYIFSFENSNGDRYFSWLLRPGRLNLFYRRDRLDNLPVGQTDSGFGERVGLSFYFDPDIFPGGTIRDNKWHFLKLDIQYPSIKLYVDGYVHYATEGNYFDITDSRVRLNRDGTIYNMPARILDKDASTIASITGFLGGSQRGSFGYNFHGRLRLLFITGLMDNSQYTCLASCNNSLVPTNYVPGSEDLNTTVGDFHVFYQPVSRTLYFNNANGEIADYNTFVKSLVYHTYGYLPPQQEENTGEGRTIEIMVRYNYTELQCINCRWIE